MSSGSAAGVLTALLNLVNNPGATSAFSSAATEIVHLRREFSHDGLPDWTGRSQEYRDTIERLYRQANIPPDSESQVQAKIRYHVGNALREIAPAKDLKALGLAVSGPRGRAANARQGMPPEVRGSRIESPFSVLALALDGVRVLQVMEIPPADRSEVDQLVVKLIQEAAAFLGRDA